mgnify:CR=1 FL=1
MRQRQASDTPDHYADLHGRFGWQVPRRFNMAAVCSRRWAADPATAQQTAVIATAPGQPDRHHSYAELPRQATRALTLGVRAAVEDAEGRVFMVRHTYINGWFMPGGGIEHGAGQGTEGAAIADRSGQAVILYPGHGGLDQGQFDTQ